MKEPQNVNEMDEKYVADRSSDEFAALLEGKPDQAPAPLLSVGQRLSGHIQSIDESSVFVDYGGRSEAVIDVQELKNEQGEVSCSVGDTIEAFVASVENEVRLTLSRRTGNVQMLRQAYENNIPVDGRVTGFNSGGLVVNLGGRRAFCPVSQIDTGYSKDLASYAGQTLTFKIVEFRGRGRNIVLSRRAHLEAEAARRADELREKLNEGAEVSGKITRLERFGAFVDLGGVEGLVHISEIAHNRVGHPKDVLRSGEEVNVKILELKGLGGDKERISLSIKALLPDPWDGALEKLQEGEVITGKVVSIQQFGAFVEVVPGVEGLVHVSQLARSRVARPDDAVSVGQEVRARIRKIDRDKKRISLSIRDLQEEEKKAVEVKEIEAFKIKENSSDDKSESVMADALRRAGLL
ncbi:MAG: 30S ribosomal protein S1 [Gemmatimonadetes bacterium]|nr:30S ribosomal protein S1 [Gemmatimonadota bacterium]